MSHVRPGGVDHCVDGVTTVRGCCSFDWFELEGRRVVILTHEAHDECLAELWRALLHQDVRASFVRRLPTRAPDEDRAPLTHDERRELSVAHDFVEAPGSVP